MAKKNRAFFKRFSKYFDANIIWQAVFGAASIICAIAVCFLDRSPTTIFDMLKDIFGTLMVFVVFVVAIRHFRERFAPKKDKLDYIDFWDDYKEDIYGDDITSFLKPLVYGLQAATYSGEETQRLYSHIDGILKSGKPLTASARGVLNMVRAVLSLFIETTRLNKPLTNLEAFEDIEKTLIHACETEIDDLELAAWCRIFRIDKLELAYELYAAGLEGSQREHYLRLALSKINECIDLITTQKDKNPDDENYATLYLSYLYRNIALIKGQLYDIHKKEEDKATCNEYILKTYEARAKLYTYFKNERKTKTITADYITQEYVLSLGEKYDLETDLTEKEKIEKEIHNHYDSWKLQSETRDMLLTKITEVINNIEASKE